MKQIMCPELMECKLGPSHSNKERLSQNSIVTAVYHLVVYITVWAHAKGEEREEKHYHGIKYSIVGTWKYFYFFKELKALHNQILNRKLSNGKHFKA